jgi:magnesium chelatase family protein
MLAQIASGAVLGVDAFMVQVEVDLGRGLPCMHVVGLPENAVREGRERVTAALANAGFPLPPRRITVNLAPADIPKSGSLYDLPLALALLAAAGALPQAALDGVCVVGELGLDGAVRPVRGVLSIAARCRAERRVHTLLCPAANAAEAVVVGDVRVLPVPSLMAALRHLQGIEPLPAACAGASASPSYDGDLDLADVHGQETARRALEIAAAGRHNLLFIGPPGSGKSMLARRLAGILPPLARAEAVEATMVHSVAGVLRPGQGLIRCRPFRAPHHTISDAGLIGGGHPLRPGEASLAHNGVLFLDELPEFRRNALESLRQPLEDGTIQVARARVAVTYPARFMLIAAMNPCPCGFFGGSGNRCVCMPLQVERYVHRVSGPLLDRIDLHVEVPPLDAACLTAGAVGESSAMVSARVVEARERQARRTARHSVPPCNADLGPAELREHCPVDTAGERLLRAAVRRLGLSARAYHRVLRVARTIADLGGSEHIAAAHLAEAVQYRSLDRTRTPR